MWLSFFHPWMLSMLALGGLPVLIHLFARRRPRVVPISSLKHVRPVTRQTQRLRRPRDIIILILRTLLVLILVFLFARPILHTVDTLANPERMRRVVLVIDRSLSMQCNEGGLTRFGSARAAALQVLDLLPTGARGNVVWVGSNYETTVDGLTDNLELLRRDIESKPVSYERASVGAALDKAVELADPGRGGRIYVISDFQATNWKDVDLTRTPANIEVLCVVVGQRVSPNHSVGSVRVVPSSPVVGEVFRVTADVGNMSPDPVELTVLLELSTTRQQKRVSLAAYSKGSVSFDCVMSQRGQFPLKVSIPQDRLSADNVRYGAVAVSPEIRVGLCSLAGGAGLGYVRHALSASSSEQNPIRVTQVPLDAVERRGRDPFDVVFLYGWDGRGHAPVARALKGSETTFVWMLPPGGGSRPVDSSLFSENGVRVSIGEWRPARPKRPLSVHVADAAHPLLDVFDEGRSGDLASSFFRGAFAVGEGDGHSIIAYADGTPALASFELSGRRFFLWNMALDPEASSFAGSNTFLPLVQELVLQNRIQKTQPVIETGSPISLPLPVDVEESTLDLTLENGSGEHRLSRDRLVIVPQGDELRMIVEKAAEPGLYKISDRSGLIQLVPVNVPAVESDLRGLARSALAQRMGSSTLVAGKEPLRAAHRGVPLWPWLLAGVVALFLAESTLLAVWKVRT